MGYCTRFNLEFKIPSGSLLEPAFLKAAVASWIRANEEASFALNYDDCSSREEATWYLCQDDLKALSDRLRNVLFIMDCMGEDGRHWRIYAKNGDAEALTPTLVWKVPDFAKTL